MKKATFKIGDKVRCIKAHEEPGHLLIKRRAYRISQIEGASFVYVKGDNWSYFASRFEKVLPNGRGL